MLKVLQIVEDVAAGVVALVVLRELWRTLRFAKRSRDHLAELDELAARARAGDELAALRIFKLAGVRRRRR